MPPKGVFAMIYHFILNPKSGRNRKLRNLESAIKEACQARKLTYHIYYTTRAGDATEYVRSMVNHTQDRQRFIAIGGDGTINEIVNSAPCNPNVEFGVIPGGTGNDFVRNFTNRKNFSDIEAQIDGGTVSLDLIKCNDLYCVNMVNIGTDCAVVQEADRLRKYRFIPSGLSYIIGVIIVFFIRKFGLPMKIVFDNGEVIDGDLTLTAIANGKFCGGGFKAAPLALLDDGKMDVVIIKKVARLQFAALVGSYKKGTYLENKLAKKYITLRQIPHMKMEFESPVPVCVDGEIKGAKSIDFSVVRDAFNFVVPQGSALIERKRKKRRKKYR